MGNGKGGRTLVFPLIQSDVASPLGNSYSVQSTILGREWQQEIGECLSLYGMIYGLLEN